MSSEAVAAVAAPSAAHALSCADLGKAYAIYARPQDRLKEWLHPGGGHRGELFWALRDISLMIRPGQTVGIVGRNGSGKSTFLQLATGVLRPSEGVLHTQGRVAALLELGTGFNPEFTGRENIRLGAALQGLDPDTIEARIPDIARFADIGHFFDHPVKLYSSGMYARLAFALVAHVDADILIVDEALAVGDAAFSQKCMRFMRSFRERGTLCFVSHDTAAVINLCDSAVWLDHGKLLAFDDARAVCREYNVATLGESRRQGAHQSGGRSLAPPATTETSDPLLSNPVVALPGCRLEHAALVDEGGAPVGALRGGERLCLRLQGQADPGASLHAGFVFKDRFGQALFGATLPVSPAAGEVGAGHFEASFVFDLPALRAGDFAFAAVLLTPDGDAPIIRARHDEAALVRVDPPQVTHGLLPIPVEVDYHIVFHAPTSGRTLHA